MKRILITGGAGFIGSNLCARLVRDKGNHIICMDNLSTGRRQNIENMLGLPNFEFIEHDIIEPVEMSVDQIYNAACPASPPAYQKSPTNTTKTCVLGMVNMLELAKAENARIMQFSTSEVYGNPQIHPQKETYFGNVNPIGERSCYDEGKRCAESLCFDYQREFGVQIKVIRIFNTYGPNMDPADGRVISNFIVQALTDRNITIYGDGKQTRSFQYIDDLIEGIYRVMNDTPDDFYGPVNLGNPDEISVEDLAKAIISITGSKSKLEFREGLADDPQRRKADITLAREVLSGWSPEINLDNGLNHTIEYFAQCIKNHE